MNSLQVILFCGLLMLLGWMFPRAPPRPRRFRYTALGYVIHRDRSDEEPELIEAYFTDADPLEDEN